MTVIDSLSDKIAGSLKQQFQWLSSKSLCILISVLSSYIYLNKNLKYISY